MSAPAGPCEWCGGPQQWTIHDGEMWVRCVGGCLELVGDEEVDHPFSLTRVEVEARTSLVGKELNGEGGVLPMKAVMPERKSAKKTEEKPKPKVESKNG